MGQEFAAVEQISINNLGATRIELHRPGGAFEYNEISIPHVFE